MTPTGINSEQQQTFAKETADSTLKELYKWQPEARNVVDSSKGYVIYYSDSLPACITKV